MANKFQVKRTSISGRTPNTTNSGNTHFIDTGELALNLTDGKLFSSNGTVSFEVGANLANQTVSGNANVGKLNVTASSGDEGGEIFLAAPANTTLSGGITIDAYQNRIRFFEQGGSARGAFIDLTQCVGGAGTNLLTGGSGIAQVNTGNGLTGGPITDTGTISVLANSGIIANATGLYVNTSYIATLTANNSTNLGGEPAAFYTNATNITTGTLGAARLPQANTTSNGAVILLDSVTNTSISVYAPTANAVKTSYDAAIAANTRAASAQTAAASAYTNAASYADSVSATAYSNATTFAANADNISSGTLNAARLPATVVQNTDSRTLSGNLVISGTSFTPSSNTVLLGNTTQRWVLNANTGSFSGAVSGITTLAAGNTTVTGFVNATSSIQGGAGLTIAGAASGITTLAAGNTTITGFANVSTSVNSALLTVGTSFIANTSGAYHTGTVNAASFTTTNFIANTTGSYPLSNSAGTALGSSTQRWILNANSANYSGQIISTDAWDTADAAGAIYLNAATGNRIDWNINGVAAPAVTTRSVGTKLVLYPQVSATSVDYGIGVETGHLWLSAAESAGGIKLYANTTQLAVANVAGITVGSGGIFPTSNSSATSLGSSTQRWVLNANTGSFAGAVSGITTLAAGNTTITGFANVTSTIQGGSSLTIAGAASGITTLAAGNTTITGFANASVSVNSALLTVGTSFIANTSQVTLGSGVLLSANGSTGTAGHTLHSNGATGSPYWAADDQGVTSVATGAGLTGGTITTTGTLSVSAQSGLLANTTGLYVNATSIAIGTVPAARLGTGTANSTTFLAGDQTYKTISTGTSVTVTDDTATNGTRFLAFANQTSGTLSTIFTDSIGLTFNPSTGTVTAAVFSATSDERLKTNINTIEDSINKISKLNGVTFSYKDSDQIGVGVIAQDVEKVFPELVSINSEGYKSVAYDGLIGLLIESIKDQQQEIFELKQTVKQLYQRGLK
jgi:hypothetical protein